MMLLQYLECGADVASFENTVSLVDQSVFERLQEHLFVINEKNGLLVHAPSLSLQARVQTERR